MTDKTMTDKPSDVVLVPREPTQEMISAGESLASMASWAGPKRTWKAMIEAFEKEMQNAR